MAVQQIKKEERGDLSPQMAMLHMRWQQMRQIELHQSIQTVRSSRSMSALKSKEYSAA